VRPSPLERDASASQAGPEQSSPGNTLKPHYRAEGGSRPLLGANEIREGAKGKPLGETREAEGQGGDRRGATAAPGGAPATSLGARGDPVGLTSAPVAASSPPLPPVKSGAADLGADFPNTLSEEAFGSAGVPSVSGAGFSTTFVRRGIRRGLKPNFTSASLVKPNFAGRLAPRRERSFSPALVCSRSWAFSSQACPRSPSCLLSRSRAWASICSNSVTLSATYGSDHDVGFRRSGKNPLAS
jgi:hypothetical protein